MVGRRTLVGMVEAGSSSDFQIKPGEPQKGAGRSRECNHRKLHKGGFQGNIRHV
jgi:hypothetical protein